jgi:radical SAM protein with 4Fe4S-binding SPASM domain
MIAIPQNAHEGAALLEKWRGIVDYVGIGGFTNRAGSLDEQGVFNSGASAATATSQAIERIVPQPCILPFREMNIWSDGRAVLCCDDWNEEHVVGDLNTQTLREIWQGEALHKARSLHLEKRGQEIEICAKCNMWREPSPGARLWS